MEEKVETLKTSNSGISPVKESNRNIYNNKNFKNNINTIKSFNSMLNSSSKKKNNQNQNYTIDTCNTKTIFENIHQEKNLKNLATKVRIQNHIIEEYQKWINILLTTINNKNKNNEYNDIGTPIQEGLQDIEKLKTKNFEIKSLVINKKVNNENMEKQIEKKKKMQNMLIKEFNEKDLSYGLNIKKEKEQLILNVQMLANELDDLNENNKQLFDKIQNDNKKQRIYDLIIKKNELKEQNKLYKKMIVLKNRKNFIDFNESLSHSIDNNNLKFRNIHKRNNDLNEDYSSIGPLSGYGEYKLEKEENVNKNFFFCGL